MVQLTEGELSLSRRVISRHLPVKELFCTISSTCVVCSDPLAAALEEVMSNGDVKAVFRAACEVRMSAGLKAFFRALLCFLSIKPPTKSSV